MARAIAPISLASAITALILCASGQDPVPPVYLTHVQIFVGSSTYEALKTSSLINGEFSFFREATSNASGPMGAFSYTGLYLSGMHTYFEIFKTGMSGISQKIEPPGRMKLAMWIDHRSQLPIIRDRLPSANIATMRNAENQPSYDYLSEDPSKAEGVTSYVSGVYPDGVVRDARGRYLQDRLLHEIVACTVTISTPEREKLVRNFRAYGYRIHEDPSQAIATGPEFTLTMRPQRQDGLRTASIEMTLNREKSGEHAYHMGDADLRFHGKRATLTFHFAKDQQK